MENDKKYHRYVQNRLRSNVVVIVITVSSSLVFVNPNIITIDINLDRQITVPFPKDELSSAKKR